MTVETDVFKCFLKVDEDCAEVTSESNPFQIRGEPLRRLGRRLLFSVWNVGRPVCDSTQIGVAYVSHRRLPTASRSPGILVPCSGTQERPDGTQYVLGCAAGVDHAAEV